MSEANFLTRPALCQIISGFTDANYIEFTTFFKERTIPAKKPYVVAADAMTPSVWFEPTEVGQTLERART
jgi:DNA ligase-1